ncbi:MAG: hypothetical protein M1825_002962 [Sarcosagium campestre]|nr:MAG: hypothetical protein M1825_002962 [Sarcosagium campestre]
MAPSQLKQLKATLRAEGIVGQQKSKKQRKRDSVGTNGIKAGSNNGVNSDRGAHRRQVLQNIREQFNPFELQGPTKEKEKFELANKSKSKAVKARPGVTKGLGEEVRKRTLLKELQARNKVGGIVDRRFGEDDTHMTPEEKMLERFTKEKQRRFKNGSSFDLEDTDDFALTHYGQSLALDDFDEASVNGSSEAEDDAPGAINALKRKHTVDAGDESLEEVDESAEPDRKRSKAEVMKEVMAKSKLHKYERQQAKEEDEDVREELDKQLPDLLKVIRGTPSSNAASLKTTADQAMINPDRAALLMQSGKSKEDIIYDQRFREMALDKRSVPSDRTKTEEEKAREEAERLKELELKRLKRMRGEDVSDDDEPADVPAHGDINAIGEQDDATMFGLGLGVGKFEQMRNLDVEGEDDFVIDEDLIASGSGFASSESDEASEDDAHDGSSDRDASDGEDAEFIGGLLSASEKKDPRFSAAPVVSSSTQDSRSTLAFTYACPESHSQFLDITKHSQIQDHPVIVQRVRALYHPKLHADNKAKLAKFAVVLFEHIIHLANNPPKTDFVTLELLIRHLHSLAKIYPLEVSTAFRSALEDVATNRPLYPSPGDLIMLTAVSTIFPTSDHFHPVVTPAMLSMTRYLDQSMPETYRDLAIGTFVQTLCLQYQRLSKRYIPEVLNYAANTLLDLAPKPMAIRASQLPLREAPALLRIRRSPVESSQRLSLWDLIDGDWPFSSQDQADIPEAKSSDSVSTRSGLLGVSILEKQVLLVRHMARLWEGKAAFYEAFQPLLDILRSLLSSNKKVLSSVAGLMRETVEELEQRIAVAAASRRPLALHHHRPLAIKTSIPKFEDSYNLDKHYDPDRERASSSKLKAEYKRERKGAMRELRKDASFIARVSLKEKKEKDYEYEKKYKRLVAEIQGEEGREAKNYEREKRLRKSKR